MPTKRYDITVNQGASFKLNVQANNSDGTVMDLTGYTAHMQVRPTKESATVLMEATTSNGTITINAPGGIVLINVGGDVTAPMTWNTGYWDLKIQSSSSNILRIVEGYASLSKEVTV